jgi:cbb3-type cytochrome oxidase cytochrome c subunit
MNVKTLKLLFLLLLAFSQPSYAGLLVEKNCNSCHRLTTEDQVNSAGPDLHYSGNKFQSEWLKDFLTNPTVIRPSGVTTDPNFLKKTPENLPAHPSISKEEVDKLVNELMKLKIPLKKNELIDTHRLTKGQRAKIKYQFERTFSCISCHQSLNLVGKVRGGISGPSLFNAGNRLQAKWVYKWLNKPEIFIAKGRMPKYKMDSATRNNFTQFLMSLKKEQIK